MTLGDSVTNGALISMFLAVLYALIRFAEHALAARNSRAKHDSAAPSNPGTTGTTEACAVCRSEVADTHDRTIEMHAAVRQFSVGQQEQTRVLGEIRDGVKALCGLAKDGKG